MKRIVVIVVVWLVVLAFWVSNAMAQTTSPNPVDVNLLSVFLQALVFGGAAPGIAFAFMEWLKVQWPTISPFATRNTAIAVSFVLAWGGWAALMLSGNMEAPEGWWAWVSYAVSIASTSGIMAQFFHGTTLEHVADPEVVAERMAVKTGEVS